MLLQIQLLKTFFRSAKSASMKGLSENIVVKNNFYGFLALLMSQEKQVLSDYFRSTLYSHRNSI